MRKIISILSTLLLVLLLVVGGLYIYYGGTKTIIFAQKQQGGEILVYLERYGDYSQSGDISEKIYWQLLNEFGLDSLKLVSGFGIFYDNPSDVAKDKLRSEIGCILDPSEAHRIPELKNTFIVNTFPKGVFTSVDFPYKGQLSIFVGMFNFYRALNKIAKDNSPSYSEGPIMEIYNMKDSVITYRLCGDKWNEFGSSRNEPMMSSER